MVNRLKPLNLFDFTGGVNLRPESFQLQENELPEMLNLEVDPRGGINTRRGWKTNAVNSVVTAEGVAYLTPTTGTVSTPDPGPLPAECVLVYKVRGPTSEGTDHTLASQWTAGGSNCSWYAKHDWSLSTVNGVTGVFASVKFGTSSSGADSASIVRPTTINPGPDTTLAVAIQLNSAGQQVVSALFGDPRGSDNYPFATLDTKFIPTTTVFDSSGVVRIGAIGTTNVWQGIIYWCELRTGTDPKGGTVIWRFDPNEYPGTGTTYTDPRGRVWTLTSAAAITPKPTPGLWNPRNAYLHTSSRLTDNSMMLVCNNNGVATRTDPSTSWLLTVASGCTAEPHGADFTSWNADAWIVRGAQPTIVFDGISATALQRSGTGNWQDDYTAPGGTDSCPIASLIASHQGHMFVANTVEDGDANLPSRIRFSHPNNPRRWAKDDYIDITEGGQRITALISFSDRLLIFKPDSVWALFGYDQDTWTLNNISRTIGCLNQQLVARSEAAVFFLSWPQGVFAYTEGGVVDEISVQIRRVFEDHSIDPAAMRNAWMGWVGRRLWVSLPYELPEQQQTSRVRPGDAITAFVFDPVVKSWTTFQGVDGNIPGPYLERIEADDDENQVAFVRKTPYSVRLDGRGDLAVDEYLPGVLAPFNTKLRTKWMDAGAPTWRKSWRRPDFLLRALALDAAVNVQVFHDFDSYNAERSFQILFSPDNQPTHYGEFVWGDGTLYGGSDQTSSVERGNTMGRAGTVQLTLAGTPGVPGGLNGIIFKYIPRRFK
jgi:hypothetical protein